MTVREDELLKHIYRQSSGGRPAPSVLVGPGDDAAVLEIGGVVALLTTDQLIAGRHVDLASASIEQAGRKAMARCVSDIAAMGGRCLASVASAALPAEFEDAQALFDAMRQWSERWGCPLVGGDIAATAGPMTLAVTALGLAHPARGPALRSQAKPGDGVYVTGAIGAALSTGWHLRFTPRLAEAQALCDALGKALGAMIDISDGLGKDAARVARASGATLEIEAAAIPLRDASAGGWRRAIGDGEDYELLFTAPKPPPEALGPAHTPVARIGRVLEARSSQATCVVVDEAGDRLDARDLGWEHTA